MRNLRLAIIPILLAVALALPGCMAKTAVERIIEARSTSDIVKDNEIVIDVNEIMVDLETIKASTEIYEQRLLVTGLFDDKAMFDEFRTRVQAVKGIKQLYWHVTYMSEAAQETNAAQLIAWHEAMKLDAKVGIELISTKGVADVNLRVAVDAFSNVYILGRARSQEELQKTLKAAREVEDVKSVVNYVEVKP